MSITFVTGLRARALASDWAYLIWLLERVIDSMLAQRYGEVGLVVACHDVPETRFAKDRRVTFVQVDFPPPMRDNDDMCADKVLKLSAGVRAALSMGGDYIALNDADDLVSNRVGELVQTHAGAPGWRSAAQMFYDYGATLLRFQRIQSPASGPFVVVRSDLLEFAVPPFSGDWADLIRSGGEERYLNLLARRHREVSILAAVGLGHYQEYSSMKGWPLEPLPFPGNVVINHRHSMSHVPGGFGSYQRELRDEPLTLRRRLRNIKRTMKMIPTLKVMTEATRSEYSVLAPHDVPANYRSQGSILWR